MSKTNTQTQTAPETITSVDPTTVLGSIHFAPTPVDDLETKVRSLGNTSQMIRYLFAHYNTDGVTPHNVRINKSHKFLTKIGITTKNGDPLRYQHVRNIALQPVSTK